MGNFKISQLQLISLGASYLMGTIVVSVFVSAVAGTESWLVGALGAVFFIPVLLIYLSLSKRHPGKNLFQINEEVFGSVGGRILSSIYFVFFFILCSQSLLEASDFLCYYVMPDTPLWAIATFFMAACVYCAKKGIATIARVSTIFSAVMLAGLLINVLMSINHSNAEYLLPVFNRPLLDYVQSTHVAVAIPYGESIFLLMFVADLGEKVSLKKAYVAVVIFTAAIMTIVHLREVVALGPMVSYATQPSLEAVRMIDIASIFSRTESLFALLLTSLTFFKALIQFTVCAMSLQQIFRLKSHQQLLLMLAPTLIICAINASGSPSDNIFWGKNVSPFIWSFFTAVLPLFTLIAAFARGIFRKVARG